MAQAERREKAERERERDFGHLVAEAHSAGLSIERPWEQEEEVYTRLAAEMAAMETVRAHTSRTGGRPGGAGRPPLPPGQRAAGAEAERERPPWAQEEEVYARLAGASLRFGRSPPHTCSAAELEALESRGVGSGSQPAAKKWIPKASLKHSASEEDLLSHPPWEQVSLACSTACRS